MNQQLGALILTLQTLLGQQDANRAATQAALDVVKALQATVAAADARPIFVGPWDNLPAQVDAAPAGATILLDPHAAYPVAITCRKPLTLRSAVKPSSVRVTPGEVLASVDSWTVAPGAMDCAVEDVRLGSTQIGTGTETAMEQFPVRPRLTRVVIVGSQLKRCVPFHAIDGVLERSWITGCMKTGAESQAVWINGPGPYRIEDNRLEGASENILIGGDRFRVDQMVPSDIQILDNDLEKPLEWKVKGPNVKNILELKAGRRITIRGNRLKGIWPDGQTGYAIMLTPRNQYGDNPWVTLEDVTIEDNLVTDASGGVNMIGDDDLQPSKRTARIAFRRNTFILSKTTMGGTGRCWQVGRGPTDVVVEDNFCSTDGVQAWYHYTNKNATNVIAGAVFRRNTFTAPFVSDTTSTGTAALSAYYPGVVWEGDTFAGTIRPKGYPDGTRLLTLDELKAEVDLTTGARLQ